MNIELLEKKSAFTIILFPLLIQLKINNTVIRAFKFPGIKINIPIMLHF